MKRAILMILLTIGYQTSWAAAYNTNDCNIIKLGEHYQIDSDSRYCLETKQNKITFVNLSSITLETIDLGQVSRSIYNNEYLVTTGKFAINNAKGAVIGLEQGDIVVVRDFNNQDIAQMIGPAAIFVPAAVGATLGVMNTVASNPNAGFRAIAIGAFAGALGGALGPVMGAGNFGVIAGGSLGVAAGGACDSCHR